jgi:hypothetical protein
MLRCPYIIYQSIKEANQTFNISTIQTTFLSRENNINFILGSLSLNNVVNVGFQGVKSILSWSGKGKNDQIRTVEGETESR